MVWLSRIGTELCRRAALGGFAFALGLAGLTQPAFSQEADQAMDEDQAVTISCDDGTALTALFDETSVELTLADGSKIKLPQKDSDTGFLYTNGKFALSGDDASARWIVGKKAPVACHFNDQQQPTHFDEPLTVDTLALPKDKANPDAQPQVNCYRFGGFMVKEVDLGEKGAASLAIAPADAACERNAGKNETPIKDDTAGYFFGAKSNFVFFQAGDGWNGGLPFVVYDAKTMKRLFEDSLQGDDFESLDVAGNTLTMKFRRVFSADCSLYLDGGTCPETIRKQTGLGEIARLPDCGAAYDAEKKRTPDYAKEIEDLPSVISYEAQLTFDGKSVAIKPLKGETACNVPT
ncbi:MAG: hypothetical protein JWM58_1662 [Rhizobium sp.]|nr:hypothetical protein [Rhizobium sp.]